MKQKITLKFTPDEIRVFAQSLAEFFLVFDAHFLHDPDAEEMLLVTKESLQEKISFNESALPVIMAMGGQYDGGIDRAKVDEIDALLQLLEARKAMRTATVDAEERAARNSVFLGLFGMEDD